ncbi:hypothetical protein CDAR_118901 [Caerostris darwini]|uniref:Uncharacterized protein n=1 Tax=Caerostris darwini TaxID=1538125 RepID=A0AAV4VA92_9ARAC|nr:hypothetical protein CDAR_118901 [Caerostris darwini]
MKPSQWKGEWVFLYLSPFSPPTSSSEAGVSLPREIRKKPYLSSHFGKYVPREVNAPTGNEILSGLIRETTYSLRSLYGWVVGVKCSPSRYVSKGLIAE